jgi:glycogen(starch) synthase
MREAVSDCVVLPPDAATLARRGLGLGPGAPLRIAYVAGPGDACGTFDHWQDGRHDPRIPVVTYSAMFYSMVAGLDATALVLIEQDKQPSKPDSRFRFAYTPHRRGGRGLRYRLDEHVFATSALGHLKAFKPDVIVVGTDAPNTLIRRLPQAKKVVLTAHNTFWPAGLRPDTVRARFRLRLLARALQRVDVAVNTSSECAAQVAELGGPAGKQSFTEIPQVLDDFYPRILPERPIAERLLYLGRMEANKGIFDLLDAFRGLASVHPGLRLDFAGAGSADAALVEAVAASGFADRIRIHGLLPATAVHRLLDETDLLICPTRSSFAEGLALVVVEAAVHGVPSLLSSIVPAKDLLPGGCRVFPVDDSRALAVELRRIVEEPDLFAELKAKVSDQRKKFTNRPESWGSQLYRSIALPL